MQRRRELDVVHAELPRKTEPVFNGTVWVRVAHVARGEFLQRRSEDADLHEFGFECFGRHAQQLSKLL